MNFKPWNWAQGARQGGGARPAGRRRARLGLESLEQRQMLAGEPIVTASLFTDTGSSSTDRISSETEVVGTITVQGTVSSFTGSFGGAPQGASPVELTGLGVLQPGGQYLIDFATLQSIRLAQFGSGVVPDGSYTINLRATDNLGRLGLASLNFTRDTTLPAAPAFSISSVFDPNQDGVTNSELVTLVGTTEPNAQVSLDRGSLVVTAGPTGQFQFTGVQLFAGLNSIGTVATDLAGNVSAFSRTVTYDPQTSVNQPPSFTKGANQTVNQNAPPQTVVNWATNISPGPPGEAGQTVNFLVSNNNSGLFSLQPVISPTGTLTYTVATGKSGTATVEVRLKDNGGTAGGGNDTSAAQTFTIQVIAAPAPRINRSTVGFYDPAASQFYLKNSNSQGLSDLIFSYGPGNSGWIPLVGDWNNDGTDSVGFYAPQSSTFFLKNGNSQGTSDLTFNFGPSNSGWVPLVGDWNGDGTDSVGFYAPQTSTFFLKNSNSQGVSDLVFTFGAAGQGWVPLVGDWNADRTDSIGFYVSASSTFFLKNANGQGLSDLTFSYGPSNSAWRPLVGDWNGPENRIAGDADGDGIVGAGDYAIWAAQFGKTGAGWSGDFNGDGSVGLADYAIWSANFGLAPTGAAPLAPAAAEAEIAEFDVSPPQSWAAAPALSATARSDSNATTKSVAADDHLLAPRPTIAPPRVVAIAPPGGFLSRLATRLRGERRA